MINPGNNRTLFHVLWRGFRIITSRGFHEITPTMHSINTVIAGLKLKNLVCFFFSFPTKEIFKILIFSLLRYSYLQCYFGAYTPKRKKLLCFFFILYIEETYLIIPPPISSLAKFPFFKQKRFHEKMLKIAKVIQKKLKGDSYFGTDFNSFFLSCMCSMILNHYIWETLYFFMKIITWIDFN